MELADIVVPLAGEIFLCYVIFTVLRYRDITLELQRGLLRYLACLLTGIILKFVFTCINVLRSKASFDRLLQFLQSELNCIIEPIKTAMFAVWILYLFICKICKFIYPYFDRIITWELTFISNVLYGVKSAILAMKLEDPMNLSALLFTIALFTIIYIVYFRSNEDYYPEYRIILLDVPDPTRFNVVRWARDVFTNYELANLYIYRVSDFDPRYYN